MSIYDLSEREVYQLKSIDPHLTDGWQDVLFQILPKVCKEGQESIAQRILTPCGIYYDRSSQSFKHTQAKTLQEIVNAYAINHPILQETIADMQSLLDTLYNEIDIYQFANQLEDILTRYAKIELSHDRPKLKQQVRNAFLYQIAYLLDDASFSIKAGIRNLNKHAVKSYLKEVYLKQQIQGWDFRNWDPFDIQKIEGIPDWIKQGAKKCQYLVVETKQYWFLIARVNKPTDNPYSFKRFLSEYSDSLGKSAIITHLAIAKDKIDDEAFTKHKRACLSRFYTVTGKIGNEVKNFVRESKKHQIQYLRPILSADINYHEEDITHIEQAIYKQLLNYEKQLTVLILIKVPRIIQLIQNNASEQNFLFYYLTQIIKQLTDGVEDFRLQPIASSSSYAEEMYLRLTSYNLLLYKLQDTIFNNQLTEAQRTQQITEPLTLLSKKFTAVNNQLADLDDYVVELRKYEAHQHNAGLLGRIFSGTTPDYTMDDIRDEYQKLREQLLTFILQLETKKRQVMVYPEYEFYQANDDDYNHYAFADGKMGIEHLPKLLKLPKDPNQFDIEVVRHLLNFEALKTKAF